MLRHSSIQTGSSGLHRCSSSFSAEQRGPSTQIGTKTPSSQISPGGHTFVTTHSPVELQRSIALMSAEHRCSPSAQPDSTQEAMSSSTLQTRPLSQSWPGSHSPSRSIGDAYGAPTAEGALRPHELRKQQAAQPVALMKFSTDQPLGVIRSSRRAVWFGVRTSRISVSAFQLVVHPRDSSHPSSDQPSA